MHKLRDQKKSIFFTPFLICAEVYMNTILIFVGVVWLSRCPTDKLYRTPVRPNPTAFFVDVTESNPGVSLRVVKVLDQNINEVLFLQPVDGHQVGSLLPLFHQGSSGAGLEPVPKLEPVFLVSTDKELGPGRENWLQDGTNILLAQNEGLFMSGTGGRNCDLQDQNDPVMQTSLAGQYSRDFGRQ